MAPRGCWVSSHPSRRKHRKHKGGWQAQRGKPAWQWLQEWILMSERTIRPSAGLWSLFPVHKGHHHRSFSLWLLGDHSFQMIEGTTQQYWHWITFKHHLPLSLQTSIQISNLSIRKELQDSGKRGYRWRKLHDININRIVMLKKKKVREERCSKKAGQLYFYF